jgi:hypothetical protein
MLLAKLCICKSVVSLAGRELRCLPQLPYSCSAELLPAAALMSAGWICIYRKHAT